MKYTGKKLHDENDIDESLFGLLNVYKAHNTYLKLLVNENKRKVIFLIAENPSVWNKIPVDEIEGFVEIKRLKLQPKRMFIKYIGPQHIINYMGPTIGMKLPLKNVRIKDRLEDSGSGYFSIEIPLKHINSTISVFKKLVDLTPQRKYEIIENYYSIRS